MTRLPSDPDDPQDGLFDDAEAHARASDPGTAQEAAQVMKTSGKADSLNQMIFDDLERLGESGITSWEFSRDHPDAERVSVSPRFSDLFLRNKIGKRGKRRRPGQTGGAPSAIYVLRQYATEMNGPEPPDDDEPKPNSPEDLGLGKPRGGSYGKRSEPSGGEEKAAERVNVASGTIGRAEAIKFIAWLNDQDFEVHEDVTVGHVLVDLSGSTPEGFGWLCRAIKQAGQAPEPWRMNKALRARDVSLLRERPGD